MQSFRRDRLTWLSYAMLAWFAFLQASPGLIVPHLREEFGLSYSAGGRQVAAFAAGSIVAGLVAGRLERRLGRRSLFWLAAAVMSVAAGGLTLGHSEPASDAALLVMGVGGGILLITIQALLSDHHGARRAIALTEANVAASLAYVALAGSLALVAALGGGWRLVVLASLLVPVAAWLVAGREPIRAPAASAGVVGGRLPGAFWVAAAMLFCTVGAEWCVTAWGASFAEQAAGLSVDTAVALMAGYFGGVVVGRATGARLTRRHPPHRLLAIALAISTVGFAILWPSTAAVPALAGLAVLGLGLGNLFPLGLAVTNALVPDRAQLANSRVVVVTSGAVLLAPLTVGSLADATSLTAAFTLVPVLLALAAIGLTAVTRGHARQLSSGSAPTR